MFIQYKESDCDVCDSRAHRSKSTKINNLNTKCRTAVSPLYSQIFSSPRYLHTRSFLKGSQCCDVSAGRRSGSRRRRRGKRRQPTNQGSAHLSDQSEFSSPVRAVFSRGRKVRTKYLMVTKTDFLVWREAFNSSARHVNFLRLIPEIFQTNKLRKPFNKI